MKENYFVIACADPIYQIVMTLFMFYSLFNTDLWNRHYKVSLKLTCIGFDVDIHF